MAERASGTVTFLLTDIEGSTRNWESSPDEMRRAIVRHDELLNALIANHRGQVLTERGEGDSFFAVFARATDAAEAATTVQRALHAEAWPEGAPIKVRMAIHTGEADGDYRGTEVNRCARIRAVGHGGQTLLSAPAATLVRGHLPVGGTLIDLGSHRLRDLTVAEHLFQLDLADIVESFPPLRSLDAYQHNLPIQLTSFVGREAQLAEVERLVRDHRLVTLTGAGGSGKTRLALQVAAGRVDEHPDGVWLVDLAPISEPALVARAVAAALQVAESAAKPLVGTLCEQLVDRDLLLVMDNCEHLIDACSALAQRLLQQVPGLRILATSREALNIAGEVTWRVPSLSLPAQDGASAVAVGASEAAALFRDRAAAHQAGFVLTDRNAPAVAQICRRLDGMPLAIELAAARVPMMAPDEILKRLEDRFRLLTGGSRTALARQQTLRAAVDWSHELLSEPERVLFRRVSIFTGGFHLDAAEQVCSGQTLPAEDVLDLLAGLVERSLVVADPSADGVVRYRLLETLRQYGREKLESSGDAHGIADAHLAYFADLAERAYRARIDESSTWLARLEQDLDNLRAALDHASSRSAEEELRLAGTLAWFWHLHSDHLPEGRERLEHALARGHESDATAARALSGAAMVAAWQGDVEAARSLGDEGLAIWTRLDQPLEVAVAQEALGWASFFGGDDAGALVHMRANLDAARSSGNPRLINRATLGVCQVLVSMGDVGTVEPMAEEALRVALELAEPRGIHYSLHFLADCALISGRSQDAVQRYAQSLQATLDYGNIAEAAIEIQGMAMGLAGIGRLDRAFRLNGAAAAKMDALGMDISGVRFWGELMERYLEPARSGAESATVQASEEAGRAMAFDAAIALAKETPGT